MGRYVYEHGNDWQYKFAFGIQDSSFGRVLEEIESEKRTDDWGYVERYISNKDNGEIVKLYIDNIENFEESVNIYCLGLQDAEKATSKYYDKIMLGKLLDHVKKDFDEVNTDCNYTFDVEY